MLISLVKQQMIELGLICSIAATSGEMGRKALMREIELGKLLGETPQPNIIKFIGCVTKQSKDVFSLLPFIQCFFVVGNLGPGTICVILFAQTEQAYVDQKAQNRFLPKTPHCVQNSHLIAEIRSLYTLIDNNLSNNRGLGNVMTV